MALEYTKYHDFSYVQTLVTKIRSVEDYSQDKPVIVVGTQINDSTNGMGSLIGDTFTVGGKADTNLGYNSLLLDFRHIMELMRRSRTGCRERLSGKCHPIRRMDLFR